MKLYFSPSTSALAIHIALLEFKRPFSLVKVDLDTQTFDGGLDYCEINPKGYVPLLGKV
ncbi:hypothetical protein [Pseudomonas syringae group genomosp. 3]|uniref:hypothetical protein n=1 Tax=Pseudomonas syringae group genomosp. 3 TaxID=251701 RepID=UPI001604B58D|nr:hypothetical protein [Pseudomonas syringae group genomosp. 3]